MWGPTKKLGWIGLVALKFIGYKQTDKHHDRQAKDTGCPTKHDSW